MPKYRIVEVDPQKYADKEGDYCAVRVGEIGGGYGFWDMFDPETGTLRNMDKPPRYLIEEARAKVEELRKEAG